MHQVKDLDLEHDLPLFKGLQNLNSFDYFDEAYLSSLFLEKVSRSKSVGADGTKVQDFEYRLTDEVALVAGKLATGKFSFTRYKEKLILKSADRAPRQVSIPTVRDRVVLRALCSALHSSVPASKGGVPHEIVRGVISAIKTWDNDACLLRIDVKNFFPSVIHRKLKSVLRVQGVSERLVDLCMLALKTPTGVGGSRNSRGIPQGLSISGALAALYMVEFDRHFQNREFSYFRYVDDILCICALGSADDVLLEISTKLKAIGLTPHPVGKRSKTEISSIAKGTDYLGYRIDKKRISVRKSSFERMFKNIQKVLTRLKYKHSDEDAVLYRLNLKITGCVFQGRRRGWLMFFSQTEDMHQLSYLDEFVRKSLSGVGFTASRVSEVKRFTRTYYEITKRFKTSLYFPNFDDFTFEQMVDLVSALGGSPRDDVIAMEYSHLKEKFDELVKVEVQGLEIDVGSLS